MNPFLWAGVMGFDNGYNQFAYIDPMRPLRCWCPDCKRSIDTVAQANTYGPCPYCGSTRAKLHSDPIA